MVKKESTLSLLFKMRLRSLKKGWAQFLAIVAIGTIAVTLFVGLQANAESLESRTNAVYEAGNLASIWVTTDTYNEADEKAIKKLLGEGDEMEKRLYAPVEVSHHSAYLAVSHGTPTISKPYGELRTLPEQNGNDFFYVDCDMEESANESSIHNTVKLGQEVEVSMDVSSYGLDAYAPLLKGFVKTGGTNVLESDTLSMKAVVTGFMNYPENITKSRYNLSTCIMSDSLFKKSFTQVIDDNYTEAGQSLIYAGLESLLGFHDLDAPYFTEGNQYLISLKNENEAKTIEGKIQDYFDRGGNATLVLLSRRSEMPFCATLSNDVTQARQFTFVFPFVFFLVGILVILTTLSQHILQERTQIGTLKAIGLSKGQIYWHYCSLTLLLVGLGTLIGEIVGPLLIPHILSLKYSIFYSLPALTYVFPVWAGILTAVCFLGVSVLVTLLICHKEVSLNPVESMRPAKPNAQLSKMKGESKGNVLALSSKMAFRNIRLNIGKSLMVTIGVMGCTALLLCGFGIEDTVYNGIDHDMTSLRNTDISVTFNGNRSKEDATEDLLSIEGVEAVEPTYSAQSTIYKEGGSQVSSRLYLLPDESKIFKITFSDEEVAISQKVSRSSGLKEGDIAHFTFSGKTYECKVGLVFEAFAYHGLMIHESNPVFEGVKEFTYSGASVYLKDQSLANQVDKKIEQRSYVLSSQTTEEWENSINDIMSGVLTMTNAVKVFAILLALVVLYNLALMNFKERTRDIATLKVLGFSRFEISFSLMLETMTLTLIGMVIGMGLGFPFLLLVMGTNIVELVEYLYCIKIVSFVYSFLLTFGVSLLTNLFLSSRISKIQMVESLKSVE